MNILGYQQQGSEIVFITSEVARIHLSFVSLHTARLYVAFAGEGAPEASYAIEGDILAIGDLQIAENEGSITVSTGEMAVRLTKQNIRMDYLRCGKLLTSAAMSWASMSIFMVWARITTATSAAWIAGASPAIWSPVSAFISAM